ncbi:MAG: type IV secretion system protein [Synergistaceae bacterium]|nr:type IV secretion system protein [Synergistaceae bacterium]
MSRKIFYLIAIMLLAVMVSQAFADDSGLDSTISEAAKLTSFSESTANSILAIARRLFQLLATLSLAIGLIRMLLTGESNVGTVMVHITKWILYVGIFTWFMANLHTVSFIPKVIVNSFIKIGQVMGRSAEVAPDDVLASGIRIYGIIIERGWNAGWGDFVGLTFIGILILTIVAVTAGFIAVAIVEMHLVICGGAVLLGFGGFEYTRDIALSYLRYAISVGVKLLMILLVYAIAVTLIPKWENEFKNVSDMSTLITSSGQILGGTVCVLMVVIMIPHAAQKIVTGAMMTFGHNAPLVGHTPYMPVDDVMRPYNQVSSVINALRGNPGNPQTLNVNPNPQPAYTARADEVMFGGSNLNPTELRPEQKTAAQYASSGSATFSNYVPPTTSQTAPRTATTRDSNISSRFDYGASTATRN